MPERRVGGISTGYQADGMGWTKQSSESGVERYSRK